MTDVSTDERHEQGRTQGSCNGQPQLAGDQDNPTDKS